MPCITWDEPRPNKNNPTNKISKVALLETELAMVTAIACALSRLYAKDIQALTYIDWAEAGVTRAEYDAWWAEHQKEDAERVEREKAAALAKLTPAERKLLGL